MAGDKRIPITVLYSPKPREVREVSLRLEPGCTVLEALQASGFLQLFPALDPQTMAVGVWGRKASLRQALREMDRVEIYRELSVDPKVARRERFVKQGARTAGLFAKKRPGAKAGY
ncbi:MAG: RnfH family protein [Rhodoferax sp.]|uniref:RnfH family protein n=1 Tax=Rhodoferax sp. TaxID=50421 RepID=UPI00260CFC92|nr:RnfH family protein [Rhodoferax sp.]MDD5336471.1 RnfH family protein [Rhodoferax sp.]